MAEVSTGARAGQIKFAKLREIYFPTAERFVLLVEREFFRADAGADAGAVIGYQFWNRGLRG